MIIKCAHIENFGKLSNVDFNFEYPLTTIYKENGYGKTTLCDFLRVMLYGLKTDKSSDKEFGLRKHYYPFSSGKFGGNIVIDVSGVEYKIERFFDQKSETKDSLTVYKNGTLTHEFESDIGKALYSLDEDSYLKTVLFNFEETKEFSSPSINAKLNDFIDGTEDSDSFDDVLKLLTDKEKEYKLLKGNGGLIDEARGELFEVNKKIENLTQIENAVGEAYIKREYLKNEIAEFDEKCKKAFEYEKKTEGYRTLNEQIKEIEDGLYSIKQEFPSGVPFVQDADALYESCDRLSNLKIHTELSLLEQNKIRRYERLNEKFNESSCKEDIDKLEKLCSDKNACQKSLSMTLGEKKEIILSTEDMGKVDKLVEEYKTCDATESEKESNNKTKTVGILLLVLGLILSSVGATVFFFLKNFYILSVVLVGVIVAVLGVISLTKKGDDRESGKEKRLELEKKISEILSSCGYIGDNVIESYYALKRDYLQSQNSSFSKKVQEQISSINEQLQALLSKYGEENEKVLIDDYKYYESIKQEVEEKKLKIKSVENECKKTENDIKATLYKYGIEPKSDLKLQAEKIKNQSHKYYDLNCDLLAYKRKAEEYKSQNGYGEYSGEPYQALLFKLNEKREDFIKLERKIDDDESACLDLQRLKSEKESLEEKIEYYKKKRQTISLTKEYLKKAEDNLQEKFVFPIKKSFVSYAEKVEKEFGEKLSMNKDFVLSFERNGENRDYRYFSAGQKEVLSLCLKLAIIDNTFKAEKPFLIMDDPFVCLDKEHFDKVKQIVKSLCSDRQVIYFTCHETRKID